jgi:hypothetical protein
MQNLEKKIIEKEAIANWEDEGGALKPVQVIEKKDNTFLICVGILVSLPFFYWLAKKIDVKLVGCQS